MPTIREIGTATAMEQLEAGDIDALFLTEAVPAPSVQALAARRADLRFVPMPTGFWRSWRRNIFPITR